MKKILEKIRHNRVLFLIGIVGIALMVIPFRSTETETVTPIAENTLQSDLSRLISDMDGVGRVHVLVTFRDGGTSLPAADDGNSTYFSGKTQIVRELAPSVRGVVVLCDGADDPGVADRIVRSVAALTDAPLCNIRVWKLK